MPRLNIYGWVATDFQGHAVARWLTDGVAIFQQPVTSPDGPWQIATRPRGTFGRGTPMPNVDGGCNALAAGGGRWMRRLDGYEPPLSGSDAWWPADGRVGDIDRAGAALALSEDALLLIWGRSPAAMLRRQDVQGETRYMDGLACWTSRGLVQVYDTRRGLWLSVQQVGPGAAKAVAFRDLTGRPWVLYQTDALGGVCHPADDASQGYLYGTPYAIYDPDVLVTEAGEAIIVWAAREGQLPEDIRWEAIPALGEGMHPFPRIEEPPEPPQPPMPPAPAPEPLAITVTDYTPSGPVPLTVEAAYEVTGHSGKPVQVWLTIDGEQVTKTHAPAGRLAYVLEQPGEYRLGAIVACDGQQRQTGAVRIVRALPAPPLPPTPPPAPIATGRAGYTQAADESRAALRKD